MWFGQSDLSGYPCIVFTPFANGQGHTPIGVSVSGMTLDSVIADLRAF